MAVLGRARPGWHIVGRRLDPAAVGWDWRGLPKRPTLKCFAFHASRTLVADASGILATLPLLLCIVGQLRRGVATLGTLAEASTTAHAPLHHASAQRLLAVWRVRLVRWEILQDGLWRVFAQNPGIYRIPGIKQRMGGGTRFADLCTSWVGKRRRLQ